MVGNEKMSKRKDTSPLEGINKAKKLGDKTADAGPTKADQGENRLQKALSQLSLASNTSGQSRRATAFSFEGVNHGKFRTMIEVEVLTKDGEPFTRNMTEKEAYDQIYKKSLKLQKHNLAAIQRSWRGHPFFCFRTKEPIDIDELPATFSYTLLEVNCEGDEEEVKIQCTIRGAGGAQGSGIDRAQIRWVKIEGTSLNVKEDEIKRWLSTYGELLSEIEEEEIRFSDDDDSEGSDIQLGTGKFSVKMRISKEIPQYLPMFGHKAKIYYRGIKKVCTNCYQGGHYRKDCERRKLDWIDYVSAFINCNEHIPEEMFGRWYQLCVKRAQESRKPNEGSKASQQPDEPDKPPEDEPRPSKGSRTERVEKKSTKRLPTKAPTTKGKANT